MIVRVRSAKGMLRLTVENPQQLQIGPFKQMISEQLGMPAHQFTLSNQPDGSRPFPVPASGGKSLQALGIKHGDLLYATYDRQEELLASEPTELDPPITSTCIVEDAVDLQLAKMDGLIRRSKDANFCRHGPNAMCDYCMPLEPYDARHLEQEKIKHLSFHAHLRKLTASSKNAAQTRNGTTALQSMPPPLEPPTFRVKVPCESGHAPYPQSMCAKCQPSAIVLQQQPWRMVDHVEFESAQIVDQFLSFWRKSGLQRFGYLYGRYEPYDKVPLGIKAVVSAIYEPPQKPASDGVELEQPDPHHTSVDALAKTLHLQKIGQIYTDLQDDGTGQGKVLCRRHADSFFLSSAECTFVAHAQLDHPSPCRYSTSGTYSSKFVTVVISGDTDNNIHLAAYQVSAVAEAMVRDEIVDATTAPNQMCVQPSTPSHYVPDVFYKYKNKYGAYVQEPARPTFPVEYLLVTLTEGFPQNPSPYFRSTKPFPIENRQGLSHQDMAAVRAHLDANGDPWTALRDFHFLVYLKATGVFQPEDWQGLVTALGQPDVSQCRALLEGNSSWKTLQMIAKEAATTERGTSSSTASAGPSGTPWACRHCTFVNGSNRSDCEMCGLPK